MEPSLQAKEQCSRILRGLDNLADNGGQKHKAALQLLADHLYIASELTKILSGV